jgi:hypothetical protein
MCVAVYQEDKSQIRKEFLIWYAFEMTDILEVHFNVVKIKERT